MTDYTELVEALRDIEKTMFALGTSSIKMDNVSIRLAYDKKWGRTAKEAAAAIEALQAEVKDLNGAIKSESEARQNAETKRYCCNCAHMDASMYDEAWYGICKLNDFEVEAIHGWGCTDWAKMEAQDGANRGF